MCVVTHFACTAACASAPATWSEWLPLQALYNAFCNGVGDVDGDTMIAIVIVFCRYALHECGAVPSSLQCDPRFDHIQHMLQSAPLGSDSSDDD